MDYQRIYNEFIQDRREKESDLEGYTEKHHILPRSLGGGDEQDNIILLTASDHYFAHVLLAKIYGGSMWFAVQMMSRASQSTIGREPRYLYAYQKKAISMEASRAFKERHKDPEYAAHHRKLALDRWKDPEYRDGQKERMRKAWQDPEYVAKMKNRRQPDFHVIHAKSKALWEDPEHRAKMVALRREQARDPAWVEKMRVVNKEINSRPEVIAKKKINTAKMWESQDRRDLQSRKIRANAYAKVKPVINLDNGVWFKNVHIAFDWLCDGNKKRPCKNRGGILEACRGNSGKKTAGGWRWAYA